VFVMPATARCSLRPNRARNPSAPPYGLPARENIWSGFAPITVRLQGAFVPCLDIAG
jgi:hypothetical protein